MINIVVVFNSTTKLMKADIQKHVLELFRRAAMPFVRLCLRNNIKLVELIAVLKECLVRAADEELRKCGKAHSASRISLMSGVHRRDTSTILKKGAVAPAGVNMTLKLLGCWQQHPDFSDGSGNARELSAEGRESEFAKLCHSVSVELNPYTMLFELERIGAIARTSKGVKLELQVYGPRGDIKDGFGFLASDVEDLVTAVDENIFNRADTPNLHIRTEYDNIPPSAISELREWLLYEGSGFHFRAREFLSKFDRDFSSKPKGESGRVRVALGSFSRIQIIEDNQSQQPSGGVE